MSSPIFSPPRLAFEYRAVPATVTAPRIELTGARAGITLDCIMGHGLAKLTGDISGEPVAQLLKTLGARTWNDVEGARVRVLFYGATFVVAGLAHSVDESVPFLLPDVIETYPARGEREPFPIQIDFIA